jgi:hypothetical protein
MPDDQSTTADSAIPPSPERRSNDMEETAKFGRERAQREEELRQAVKRRRAEDSASSKKASEGLAKKQSRSKEGQEKYRQDQRKRDTDLAMQRLRQEEAKRLEEQKEQMAKERHQKQERYLDNLREIAALHAVHQKRMQAIKKDEETDRRHAEQHRLSAYHEAERSERGKIENAEREARARKSLLDEELRSRLYQLEITERTRLHDLEGFIPAPQGASRTRSDALVARRRAIEADLEIQRQSAANDIRLRKSAIDVDVNCAMHAGFRSMKLSASTPIVSTRLHGSTDRVVRREITKRPLDRTLRSSKNAHSKCPGGGMADTPALGAGTRKGVEVQVLSWAPIGTKGASPLSWALLKRCRSRPAEPVFATVF